MASASHAVVNGRLSPGDSCVHLADHVIELHGWDSVAEGWYGPCEVNGDVPGADRIVQRLRDVQRGFHGQMTCRVPGHAPVKFRTLLNDLGDAALAMISLDHLGSGPVEVVTVIPRHRLASLRPEFAFEFVSFLRFLRGVSEGAELKLHDYIQDVLAKAHDRCSLVFTVNNAPVGEEYCIPLSCHVEKLCASVLKWLAKRDRGGAISMQART